MLIILILLLLVFGGGLFSGGYGYGNTTHISLGAILVVILIIYLLR